VSKVSVIIPSRNERFLPETVHDLISKARGDVEIIAVLDGYWPDPPLPDYSNLILIHRSESKGMRASINAGASIARGEWLMKVDAHVMMMEGYDLELQRECEHNWMMIPRRYSLDPETWTCREKSPVDYHYTDCPMTNTEYYQTHGVIWPERDRERKDILIDDTPSWQGSMWFMHKSWADHLLPMSEHGYGTFSQEPQELGFKTWLGGGAIKINKNVWGAHLHKGHQYGRMYSANMGEIRQGHKYSAWYWTTNQWPDRIHDYEWFVEKFMPMPKWPDNWRELLQAYQRTHQNGPDY